MSEKVKLIPTILLMFYGRAVFGENYGYLNLRIKTNRGDAADTDEAQKKGKSSVSLCLKC